MTIELLVYADRGGMWRARATQGSVTVYARSAEPDTAALRAVLRLRSRPLSSGRAASSAA